MTQFRCAYTMRKMVYFFSRENIYVLRCCEYIFISGDYQRRKLILCARYAGQQPNCPWCENFQTILFIYYFPSIIYEEDTFLFRKHRKNPFYQQTILLSVCVLDGCVRVCLCGCVIIGWLFIRLSFYKLLWLFFLHYPICIARLFPEFVPS